MRKSAIVVSLFLGLALSACKSVPEVSATLSEPDPALFDKRLAGMWYAVGPAGYINGFAYLLIIPRKDGASFDVTGVMVSRKGAKSVQWLRATAYASLVDGETYYNVKRVAWVGNDYTPEETTSFLILKPKIAADSSLMFLHAMESEALGKIAEERGIKKRKLPPEAPYIILDVSRDDLIRLIRETAHERLFSVITGPFYRVGPDFRSLGAPSGDVSPGLGAKFGTWQVACDAADVSKAVQPCRVYDSAEYVVLSFTDPVVFGRDRCKTSGAIAQVDATMPIWFGPEISLKVEATPNKVRADIVDLIERMHLGRMLRLEYMACPGGETKHADVALEGFAAAYAAAKSLAYPVGPE